MTVFVIGGTRFIGPPTVRELVRRGHSVTVFHRGQSNSELPASVSVALGDRNDQSALKSALDQAQPDSVLDLCAYFERHIDVFQAASAGAKFRRLLVSSCDVYRNYGGLIGLEEGAPDATPLKEDAPLRVVRYPYRSGQNAREGFEDYDKIPLEESTLRAGGMVARLPMVYGPGDTQHRVRQYLRRLDQGRKAIVLGQQEAVWQTCRAHVRQVARALVTILEKGSEEEVYNVGEETALTEGQWVQAIIDQSGQKASLALLPDEKVSSLDGHIERPRWHLAVDSSKLRNTLHFSEDETFSDGLKETIDWERANPGEPLDPAEIEAEDRLLAEA